MCVCVCVSDFRMEDKFSVLSHFKVFMNQVVETVANLILAFFFSYLKEDWGEMTVFVVFFATLT